MKEHSGKHFLLFLGKHYDWTWCNGNLHLKWGCKELNKNLFCIKEQN